MTKEQRTEMTRIPDLTYSDQYKLEKEDNVYILRLAKSKVFVRVHTHHCGCE